MVVGFLKPGGIENTRDEEYFWDSARNAKIYRGARRRRIHKRWIQYYKKETYKHIVDAFVSMGGNADRSGTIMKDTIVNIIKNEFELTYNMEAFLEGFGENR